MERDKLLGKRKKKFNACPNPLFVQWLTEWKNEADEKGWNSRFTYGKALNTIKKYPMVFETGKDCKVLENFGDKICKMLDTKLAKHIAQYGTTAPVAATETTSSQHTDPPRTTHSSSNRLSSSSTMSDLDHSNLTIPEPPSDEALTPQGTRKKRNTGPRTPREYVPAYGSGPFALIITLYKNNQALGSHGYMTKAELIREGQGLADKSFTMPDPGGRYTAWSSMGTLVKKGYVIKESNPAKFYITEAGCALASKLEAVKDSPTNIEDVPRFSSSPEMYNKPRKVDHSPPKRSKKTSTITKEYFIELDSDDDDDDDDDDGLGDQLTSSNGNLSFWYVDNDANLVTMKNSAAVLIDDDLGIGFMIKCKYQDLLASGIRYQLDNSRSMENGFRFAYLHNDDAPDVCSPPAPEKINKISKENLHLGRDRSTIPCTVTHDESSRGNKDSTHNITEPRVGYGSRSHAEGSRSNTKDILDYCADTHDYQISSSQTSSHSHSSIHSVTSAKDLPVYRGPSSSRLNVDYQSKTLNSDSQTSGHSGTNEGTKTVPTSLYVMEPGTFDIVLCVDNQEHYGGGRKADLLPELVKNRVNFDVRKLQVGDFLWVAREKTQALAGHLAMPTGRELVLDYIIERKRMDDLAGSIKDGRFKEQKFRLRNSGLRCPIYLVEEFGSNQHFSIKEETLNQAVMNTQIIDEFYVKKTKDSKESLAYLTLMTRYLNTYYKNKRLMACNMCDLLDYKEPYNMANKKQMLMTFEEFNRATVKNKTLTVKELFGKQLMQLHGMSGDKAGVILETYSTPQMLLRAYNHCSSEKEKQSLLANIKFGGMSRNVGISLSRNVHQLYSSATLS